MLTEFLPDSYEHSLHISYFQQSIKLRSSYRKEKIAENLSLNDEFYSVVEFLFHK